MQLYWDPFQGSALCRPGPSTPSRSRPLFSLIFGTVSFFFFLNQHICSQRNVMRLPTLLFSVRYIGVFEIIRNILCLLAYGRCMGPVAISSIALLSICTEFIPSGSDKRSG